MHVPISSGKGSSGVKLNEASREPPPIGFIATSKKHLFLRRDKTNRSPAKRSQTAPKASRRSSLDIDEFSSNSSLLREPILTIIETNSSALPDCRKTLVTWPPSLSVSE